MKVRVVSTASHAKAVQVVTYRNNKRIVLKHIGSAHSEAELKQMIHLAQQWIQKHSHQLSLFPQPSTLLVSLDNCNFLGVKYRFFYNTINKILHLMGLNVLPDLLNDLATIRVFEPASKLQSIRLIEDYFGIQHVRKNYYKLVPQHYQLKNITERKVLEFVKQHYQCSFNLLFYDVTTLYFETFEEDKLRANGFSKDNKMHQPQILVALMVTQDGFPICYDIFSGNTFEGHTLIPVVKRFMQKHNISSVTIVADAGMISKSNIEELQKHKIDYIVGARLGNLPKWLIDKIDKELERINGHSIRIKTDKGDLICSYSTPRYHKDKYEMEQQIQKAKDILENPHKKKRIKFIKMTESKVELNEELIQKTKQLLGIKGYYTSLDSSVADDRMIIERYHELYRIEQAFRISKSDIKTRPIYHYKEEPIQLHILICFIALAISKHIELKTGVSIKRFVQESRRVLDGEIYDKMNEKKFNISTPIPKNLSEIINKLFTPH
ncbi:MAG: IS1634 family transposase [Bacteroidia bacterium]|nr:MAG: IS1634 family transposase [Bacteroidia bacterium]GIV28167.1 MAG: IS1634 family transposase [Bacteroidia bacterium]GIV28294.1 MAG: IS1634 family transposase [Bacteroidia bacterium]GIV28329.1 MAG: IS1634 family transposase [Bacteroidia bacterium]